MGRLVEGVQRPEGLRHHVRRHVELTRELVGWIEADDPRELKRFSDANRDNVAEDHDGATVFLARNDWQLQRVQKDWPALRFQSTREHAQPGAQAAPS